MSDYDPADGRPFQPMLQAFASESVYVFHDSGLVGLEVGTFGVDGNDHETPVTLGLAVEDARRVARELMRRADEVSGSA